MYLLSVAISEHIRSNSNFYVITSQWRGEHFNIQSSVKGSCHYCLCLIRWKWHGKVWILLHLNRKVIDVASKCTKKKYLGGWKKYPARPTYDVMLYFRNFCRPPLPLVTQKWPKIKEFYDRRGKMALINSNISGYISCISELLRVLALFGG